MIQKIYLFVALLIAISSFGQKQQASPYSFFGIGNNFLSKTVEENLMGGVGTAVSSPGTLNFSNPAALGGMRVTTYGLGVINTLNQLYDGETTQENSVFSLSYLGLGIPFGNKGGAIVGLKARSGIGYTMYATDATDDDVFYTFEGSGGASSLFISGGYEVFKGFSLGIETAFIFGNIEHLVTLNQEDVIYDTQEISVAKLSGLETKIGLFYTTMLSERNNLNLGVTFENESTIDVTETSLFYNGFYTSDLNELHETNEVVEFTGDTTTPLNTTVAVAYGVGGKWQTSVEYSFRDALSFSGETLINNIRGVVYNKYSRLSVGGYYIPKINSLTSYFQRVVYRFGFKYEDTGMELSNEAITDLGMSFGVGLPLGKGLTNLNIGVEVGKKGEVSDALVEEKYINVRMGISLGDKWFRKRKID